MRSLAKEEPVVALQGPRAVGKTTLLRAIAATEGRETVDLDDLATREAAAADPATFVSGPPPVCIDEYQQVPVILDAIKAELNRDSSAGRFIITGSTRHDALPRAAQALTGRLHLGTLFPFSQGEIAGRRENLVEFLFREGSRLVTAEPSSTSREEYIQRVIVGGFPMALGRTEAARNRWFDDCVTVTVSLERDVAELSRVRQRRALPRLLTRLAGQTAQMLNMASAGESVGLKADTAENYTRLLEAIFLVHRLPAWGKSLRARAVASPKLHVVDSGLTARLLRLSPSKLARREPTSLQEFGHLFETFVVAEVLKQASWMEGITGCGHWRTHDGAEVDLLIERDDGGIVGIEVKAGSREQDKDLTGLRILKGELGDAFVAGAVLYTGARAYTVEERIHVVPADAPSASPPGEGGLPVAGLAEVILGKGVGLGGIELGRLVKVVGEGLLGTCLPKPSPNPLNSSPPTDPQSTPPFRTPGALGTERPYTYPHSMSPGLQPTTSPGAQRNNRF